MAKDGEGAKGEQSVCLRVNHEMAERAVERSKCKQREGCKRVFFRALFFMVVSPLAGSG